MDAGPLLCPRCSARLAPVRDDHGAGAGCDACGGRAVTFFDLPRALPAATALALEHALRAAKNRGERPCPRCSRAMREVPAGGRGPPVVVAGCTTCRLAWFDADGVARLVPRAPRRRRGPLGPLDTAEALARYELERKRDAVVSPGVELAGSEGVAAALGLPTVFGAPRLEKRPWATYAIAAACVAVAAALVAMGLVTSPVRVLRAAIEAWGFVPAEPGRNHGATWVTSVFLHGSVLHLVVNVWCLLLAGRHVENRLGPWRLVALFALASVAGTLLDLALHSRSTIPRVGASGGISGLFAYFAFTFPHSDIGVYLPDWHWDKRYSYVRVRVPVPWMFAFWLTLQLLGLLGAGMGVAYAMHLGGVLAGIGAWAWRPLLRLRVASPPPALPWPVPGPDPVAHLGKLVGVVMPALATSSSPLPGRAGFELEPETASARPASSPLPAGEAAPRREAVATPAGGAAVSPAVGPAARPGEWTIEIGVRDALRSLLRRSVRAAPLWAALCGLLLGLCAAVSAQGAFVEFTEFTYVITIASLAAGIPTGLILGTGLIEEVRFAGWVPCGMAAAASVVLVVIVDVLVGLFIPVTTLYRVLVPLMASTGAVGAVLRATWAEN